jgi:hypothetical protein
MRIKIEIGHVVIRHSFEWMGMRAVGEKNNLCLEKSFSNDFYGSTHFSVMHLYDGWV